MNVLLRNIIAKTPKHTRLFIAPKNPNTPKPHEIAEEEEKELTDWGKIDEKDTGLDDVEPSKDGYDNYWAEKLSSYEDWTRS